MDIADLLDIDMAGAAITLDSGFDSDYNRAMIGRYGLRMVIKPNRRKTNNPSKLEAIADMIETDREIYKERYKIERCFAWEDVYRKLVIRYERLQCTHLGFKYLAYFNDQSALVYQEEIATTRYEFTQKQDSTFMPPCQFVVLVDKEF